MAFASFFSPPAEPVVDQWQKLSEQEGELGVDIFRQGETLFIRSTLAGVEPEALDISIDGDLLTIRGARHMSQDVREEDWFHKECYWGSFSRSIVLPLDVYPERAEASLHQGVLTLRLPIRMHHRRLEIHPMEEIQSSE
jgi:HSP20 family protein